MARDADYGPAIRHALNCSDAVTAVSDFLQRETHELFGFDRPIDVIHNFADLRPAQRSREEVRRELRVAGEVLILHSSNLRPVKRIDLLLETVAHISPRNSFKLVILAGDDFAPFMPDVQRLKLEDRMIVKRNVADIEEYLQAADLALYTSETESFCLGILEAMRSAHPTASAFKVGGIPEVVDHNTTGILIPTADPIAIARAGEQLIPNPEKRIQMGRTSAQDRAERHFSVPLT